MSEPIVVEALSKRIEFRDLDALQEHVEDILAARGGVFAPLELAAFRALAAHANGGTPPEVAAVLRATGIYTPPRPAEPETPLDDRLAEAVERLEVVEAERVEVWDRRMAAEQAAEAEYKAAQLRANRGNPTAEYALADLDARLKARAREAQDDYRRANEACVRARGRVNALAMARDRWIRSQAATFHNPEDPSKPLTAEQVAARRANGR